MKLLMAARLFFVAICSLTAALVAQDGLAGDWWSVGIGGFLWACFALFAAAPYENGGDR